MSVEEIVRLMGMTTACIAGLMFMGTICYILIKCFTSDLK